MFSVSTRSDIGVHATSGSGLLCALVLAIAFIAPGSMKAAHFSGASITYDCLGGNNYMIHLDVFLDCSGSPLTPQAVQFSNSCGISFAINSLMPTSQTEISQLCDAELVNSTCNGGGLPGFMHYQYEIPVFLAPCDFWTISWSICCRNNMVNVVGTPGLYAQATVNNAGGACDDSPQFGSMGIPFVCVGDPVQYNPGVFDTDGNSLVFSLIPARFATPAPTSVTYQGGYSGAVPIPGITIDPTTGQLSFTPATVGNYTVVIQVNSYDASGVLVGTVMADIMFVVQACNGLAPTTTGLSNNTGGTILGPGAIEVCADQDFCVDLVFTDNEPTSVIGIVATTITQLPGATFTIVGTNPATATLCWTADAAIMPFNLQIQATDNECPIDNISTTSILITEAAPPPIPPDPGEDASVQVCAGGSNVNLFSQLGGMPDAGGTWSDPSMNPHSGTFITGTDVAGAYTYRVANGCLVATATVTVSLSVGANAGTNGSIATCSSGPPIDLMTVLGGSPDPGGTWSGPGGPGFSGTYDPASNGPGAYIYTIPAANGCPASSATVTVTEEQAVNAGSNAYVTTCSNSAAFSLFAELGGSAQPGGIWNGPSPVVGGQYSPLFMTPGNYVYTVNGIAPCSNASATVVVEEIVAPSAGASAPLQVCATGASIDLFTALGGMPNPGGTWSGPSTVIAGSYDPVTMSPGPYVYTVTGTAPCASVSSTITVTEVSEPSAGMDAILAVCSTSSVTSLFDQLGPTAGPGGTWSGPSTVLGGQYDAASMDPGDYVYTVNGLTPCPSASATVSVTETAAPDAGIGAQVLLCSTDAPVDLFANLGGTPDGGGTWTGPSPIVGGQYDPASMSPGDFTYTVVGTAPCGNASAVIEVSEIPAPSAGLDGLLSICSDGIPVSLFNALGGDPDPGGTWSGPSVVAGGTYDPSSMVAGAYTYQVAGVPPCASVQAIVTVEEETAPNAGSDGSATLCSDGGAVDLFTLLGGTPDPGGLWSGPSVVVNGLFDPAAMIPGGYVYTLSGAAPCADASAQVTITVDPAPDAGDDAGLSVCSTDAPLDLFSALGGSPDPGGQWTGPVAVVNGTFDPASMPSGDYTYTVNSAASCASDLAIVTVALVQAPLNAAGTDGILSVCGSAAGSNLIASLGGSPQAGGTWTGPSPVNGGIYDPATMEPGAYVYTVLAPVPCPAVSASVVVTEIPAPYAGTDGDLVLCDTNGPTGLQTALGNNPEEGGTWSGPSPVQDGMFDPATMVAGAYVYTLAGSAPCPSASATVVVTVNTSPDAGTGSLASFCTTDVPVALFDLLQGEPDPSGTWTGPQGGSNGVLDPATALPGIYSYTVAGAAPCVPAQASISITLVTSENAGTNGSTLVCANDGDLDLFDLLGGAPDLTGAWTDPLGEPFNGLFDPGQDSAGVYVYTVSPPAPCSSLSAEVLVEVLPVPHGNVIVESDLSCVPTTVILSHDYTGPGTSVWTTGLGPNVEDPGPLTLVYEIPGSYDVSVTIDGGNGCAPVTLVADDPIAVFDKPTADMIMLPEFLSTTHPEAYFNNLSQGASVYEWTINGELVSTAEDLIYRFPDVLGDEYVVCLTAYASLSCADTICLDVVVEDGMSVFVPNTFTPNDDGINDEFLAIMNGIDPDSYRLEIFDRWGELVFATNNPSGSWDGTLGGTDAPVDVYVWKLSVRDRLTTRRMERSGHVTLLR